MSEDRDYDVEPFDERYQALDRPEREGLESFWSDIVDFLDETDRDWVRKQDIKEAQDITNRRFSQGYDGFIEVFEPPVGVGDAFAFYEMDYEKIVYVGDEIGISSPSRRELRSRMDRYLEGG